MNSDRWIALGVVIALVGVIVAVGAWLWPRDSEGSNAGPATGSSEPSETVPPDISHNDGVNDNTTQDDLDDPPSPADKPRTNDDSDNEPDVYSAQNQIIGDPYGLDTNDVATVDGKRYGDALVLPTNTYFPEFSLEFALGRQCTKFTTTLALDDFTSRDVGVVVSVQTESKTLDEYTIEFGQKPILIDVDLASPSRLVIQSKYFELMDTYDLDPTPGPVLLAPQFTCVETPPDPQRTD